MEARTLEHRHAAARRLVMTSVVFVALYAACNQLTSARRDIGQAVFDWERAIPFVPWTIVPYLSIIGFFVASFFVGRDRAALDRHVGALLLDLGVSIVLYAAFPLRFMFERPELDGAFGALFQLLSATDLPYNRAPSLHISVLVILWFRLAPLLGGWQRRALDAWFLLIGLSVLTTWQHHCIDVPAGAAVGLACVRAVSPAGRRVLQRALSAAAAMRPAFRRLSLPAA